MGSLSELPLNVFVFLEVQICQCLSQLLVGDERSLNDRCYIDKQIPRKTKSSEEADLPHKTKGGKVISTYDCFLTGDHLLFIVPNALKVAC